MDNVGVRTRSKYGHSSCPMVDCSSWLFGGVSKWFRFIWTAEELRITRRQLSIPFEHMKFSWAERNSGIHDLSVNSFLFPSKHMKLPWANLPVDTMFALTTSNAVNLQLS